MVQRIRSYGIQLLLNFMLQFLRIFSLNISLYDFFGYFGAFSLVVFNFIQLKNDGFASGFFRSLIKGRESSRKVFLSLKVAETLLFSLFQYAILSMFIVEPFQLMFDNRGVAYFAIVFFAPLVFIIGSFLMRAKPMKYLDLLTPAFPLALCFSKIGCFCLGCCGGFKTETFGLLNVLDYAKEFPVQLVESAEALVIFFILLKLRKNAKLGTMFPFYLMLYGGMRFFSEFLRNEADVFGPFKFAHLFCVIAFVLGLIEYFIAKRYAQKVDSILHV